MPKNKKDPVVEEEVLTPEVLEEVEEGTEESTISDDDLQSQITQLTKKLADQEEITKRAQSDYFRLKQEFDGYITRSDAGKKSGEVDSLVKTLSKILPFVNSLEQSLTYIPEDLAGHTWVQGISLIYTKTIADLELLGVSKISAQVGQDVDFNLHAPMGMEPTDDQDLKNKIIKVVQVGYIYEKGDTKKVVVPASVMVGA